MLNEWRFLDFHYVQFIFWIILLVILAIYLQTNLQNKLKDKLGAYGRKMLLSHFSLNRYYFKFIAMSLGLGLIIIALMRPQIPGEVIHIKSEGIELMILADVSESMMAEDVNPNRLTLMKYDLMRFVDLLEGHSVGLVVFAGSSHLLSPLTKDPSILKMYIDGLTINSVSTQGTEIGNAIDVAIEAFEKGGKKNLAQDKTVTRAILIVSDGEDHDQESIEKAKKLIEEKNIHVFTIAYGTETGAKIPVRDSLGNLIDFKKDKKYNDVVTRVNNKFLKDLASSGGGEFFSAIEPVDYLSILVSKLNEFQKQESDDQKSILYKELFQYFLIPGIVLVMVGLGITTKIKLASSQIMIFFIISCLMMISCESQAEFKSILGWYHYEKAQKYLSKNQTSQAERHLLRALKYDPNASEIHNALGILFLEIHRTQDACESFKIANSLAQDPQEQFLSRFNLGVCWHFQNKVPEALDAYLKALDIEPQSYETKVNIELLFQNQGGSGGENSDSSQKKDQENKQEPQRYQKNIQSKKFNSEQLSEAQMRKIIEEMRNQEQKVSQEYHKYHRKDKTKEKDW